MDRNKRKRWNWGAVYACDLCGHIYEGLLCDAPYPYNEVVGKVRCGNCYSGYYELATECKSCKEPFCDCNDYGICNSCIEDNSKLDMAIEIGSNNMDDVRVNEIAKKLLSAKQINTILLDHIRNNAETYARQIKWYCQDGDNIFVMSDILKEREASNG